MTKLVYIVDDDSLVVSTHSTLLKSEGYDVAVGYSVDQALDYLRENVPDCVVSDGNMNGRSGVEILDQIDGDEKLRKVGFVMVSAYVKPEIKDKVLGLGREFLDKGTSIDDLVAAVQRQISLHQQQ